MRFVKTFILLAAGIVGGVLGNLLAGFIQDDLWNNVFTLQRLAWTLGGIIVTTVLAAWIDARREDFRPFPVTPKTITANPVAQIVVNATPFGLSPALPPVGESALPEPELKVNEATVIRDTISRANRERVHLLRKEAIDRLAQLSYSPQIQEAFSLVFGELVNNAFEHGCASATCSITLEIDVTPAYVILIVKNGRGVKFNVDEALQTAIDKLRANPHERRGRGLITVYNLADTLETLPNRDGVKVVIYYDRVILNTQHLDKLKIIEVLGGKTNPSITRRLLYEATNTPAESLIVHFPKSESSEVFTRALDIYAFYRSLGKKFALFLGDAGWLHSRMNFHMLPPEMISFSWDEALRKVGRAELRTKVAELCRTGKLRDQ